ncbi:hypothetical protein Smp_136420 [Schistosoma mansoni]|uniref:hypothetical protein n=1 Tax=Schistosoma mansoni TaxID=6183 RepID=UPI00022DCC48|nr:hypothetical protein Smp_136420 [Schistosoma mansoni]|eukprot:XP_018655571.1 hypothetical protein Smp_136420 [Schistosoma mansoni]
MNKPNSSITQNHYYAIDLQTDFQLQTPCISNFLDYDLSPSELRNDNNNNLLEGGGEQCQEISKIPINQISSFHSKPTFNFGKRQAFHDFKELLLDIYHDENGSFINKDQDDISNGSQYPRPSSIVSSTSNSITSINQNQSALYNYSNDIHRIDPTLRRHKELPTSKENSALHNDTENFINNQVNNEDIYLNDNNNLTKIQEGKLINSKLPKG